MSDDAAPPAGEDWRARLDAIAGDPAALLALLRTEAANGPTPLAIAAYEALRPHLAEPSPRDGAVVWIARRLERIEDAATYSRRLLEARPDDVELRYALARDLQKLERRDEALAELKAVVARAPRHIGARVTLARMAAAAGDKAGALAHFQMAADGEEPERLGARREVALALAALGREAEALGAWFSLLSRDPGNVVAHRHLAAHFLKAGDRERALVHAEAAAASAPDHVASLVSLAHHQTGLGRLDAAAATLETALAREPAHAGAWRDIAHVERRRGRPAESLAAFRRLADLKPDDLAVAVDVARAALAAGHADEALELARRAFDAASLAGADEPMGRAAHIAHDAKAFDEAHRMARAAAETALASGDAARDVALPGLNVLTWLRASEDVLELSERAIARFGPSRTLVLQAGRAALTFGRTRRAAAHAAGVEPADAPALRFIVAAHLADGAPDLARAALAGAALDDKERALAEAEIAEAVWRPGEALARLETVTAMEPDAIAHRRLALRYAVAACDLPAAERHAAAMIALAPQKGRTRPGVPGVLGALFHEARLNPPAMAAAARMLGENDAAALAALVEEEAGSTPIALAALIGWRRTGLFAPAPTETAIPRRLTQFWDGPRSPDLDALADGWRAMNPDFAYQSFDRRAAGDFLRRRTPPRVLGAFRRARHVAQAADLFRLAWLSVEGGVYVDADDRCLSPLADWLPPDASLVLFQEYWGSAGNNFIAAAPNHPVVVAALDAAVEEAIGPNFDNIWLASGPGALSRALAAEIAKDGARRPLPGLVLFDRHETGDRIAPMQPLAYRRQGHWTHTAG